jgi:hypothetical protein
MSRKRGRKESIIFIRLYYIIKQRIKNIKIKSKSSTLSTNHFLSAWRLFSFCLKKLGQSCGWNDLWTHFEYWQLFLWMDFGITVCYEFLETPQHSHWLIRCLSLLNFSKIGYLKFNEQNSKDIEAKGSSFSIGDAVILTQESMEELGMEGDYR